VVDHLKSSPFDLVEPYHPLKRIPQISGGPLPHSLPVAASGPGFTSWTADAFGTNSGSRYGLPRIRIKAWNSPFPSFLLPHPFMSSALACVGGTTDTLPHYCLLRRPRPLRLRAFFFREVVASLAPLVRVGFVCPFLETLGGTVATTFNWRCPRRKKTPLTPFPNRFDTR